MASGEELASAVNRWKVTRTQSSSVQSKYDDLIAIQDFGMRSKIHPCRRGCGDGSLHTESIRFTQPDGGGEGRTVKQIAVSPTGNSTSQSRYAANTLEGLIWTSTLGPAPRGARQNLLFASEWYKKFHLETTLAICSPGGGVFEDVPD
ncbi:MAG: hypothetical protein R3F11_10310 [Verrucomicrobiales bacterium]